MDSKAYSEEKHGRIVVKPANNEFYILTGKSQYFKVGMVKIEDKNEVAFNKSQLKFMGNIILSPKSK
tara:strand:- start:408 stop:608 length:201 start_codon:yes stop_codon:yes gene_type:complete